MLNNLWKSISIHMDTDNMIPRNQYYGINIVITNVTFMENGE